MRIFLLWQKQSSKFIKFCDKDSQLLIVLLNPLLWSRWCIRNSCSIHIGFTTPQTTYVLLTVCRRLGNMALRYAAVGAEFTPSVIYMSRLRLHSRLDARWSSAHLQPELRRQLQVSWRRHIQHVQCRWNNFEIILAFYFTCNGGINDCMSASMRTKIYFMTYFGRLCFTTVSGVL